jgi:hypothetical protein
LDILLIKNKKVRWISKPHGISILSGVRGSVGDTEWQ